MEPSYTLQEAEVLGLSMSRVNYPQDLSKLEPHRGFYTRLVVHHGGSRDYTLRELIDLHMRKEGMGAIGYHFIIDPAGELLQVRDLQFKGAHAYPNSGKLGLGFLRSFDSRGPNTRERATFQQFTARLHEQSDIHILGHNQDQLLELAARYRFVTDYPEIAKRIWTPTSKDDFQRAKEDLLKLSQDLLFMDFVIKLKTCPGIYGIKELLHDE